MPMSEISSWRQSTPRAAFGAVLAILLLALAAAMALAPAKAHAVVYDSQEGLLETEDSAAVLGTYLSSDCHALLARVNEIRKEAHNEGIQVDGKVVSGTPLKWSESLEAAAQIRAVEASLVQDHTRPNGESCFKVMDNQAHSNAECLAWMWAASVELWYSEKQAYLQTGEWTPYTGHYVAMISDSYQYIGLGAFAFRGTVCTAGEFSSRDAGVGTARPDGPAVQVINVKAQEADAYTAASFSDVDPAGWCVSQSWLRAALVGGFMEGYKTNNGTGYTHTFGPGDNLTRAQAAVILYRLAHPFSTDTVNVADYAKDNTTGLPDVKPGTWYTAAVNWAQKAGIVTGYQDKKTGKYTAFGPDDSVTRAQLATMIARYCVDFSGMAPVAAADVAQTLASFPDNASIESWAKDGVAFCASEGILSGYSGNKNFGPNDNATREQMAKIIVGTAITVMYAGEDEEQAADAANADAAGAAEGDGSSEASQGSGASEPGDGAGEGAGAGTDSGASTNPTSGAASSATSITLRANGTSMSMTLADTAAAKALVEQLRNGPISVSMRAYGGFEKVGTLPQALPTSDRQVTTAPGDVMLYQGNQLTIFHGANTWAYTPLGHIEGATADSLLAAFGEGDVTVELSL